MIISLFILFLITAIISFVFKKINTVNIWVTYGVDIIVVVVLFFLSGSNAIKFLLEDPDFILIIILLFVGLFILQLISNIIVIGKPFIKEKETNSSPYILDDDLIK